MLAGMVAPLESPLSEEPLPQWLLPHQADAVRRARAILSRFGGVLLADGVGLGKTWLGLALAELEQRDGGRAIALIPPAVRSEWERAIEDSGVHLQLISHAGVMSTWHGPDDGLTLLIVDEAHAFRNPRTRRYDALARMALGRRVALLSATPYNNRPADLHALINLFAADDRFRELGIADLGRALRDVGAAAAPALAAVTVCRSRRLVELVFPDTRRRFPRRVLQPLVRYDLNRCYGGRLSELVGAVTSLGAAPAEQASALMQLGLLRRLESSRAAFRRSILRHLAFLDEVERACEEGVSIDRADYRSLFPRGDGDDLQLVMWPVLKPGEGAGAADDARRAWRVALESAREIVEEASSSGDAKHEALEALLDGPLRGMRVIVFTEFRDSALDLLRRMRAKRRVIAVAGADAWAGTGMVSRDEALNAFAPRSRGVRPDPLMTADVLIATDVAGAGLNLQDAQAVVNYDLPWNPVRVMQRVGRVDRLGSPHRQVHIAHLQPGDDLAALSAVLRALRGKLTSAGRLGGSEPDPLAALWWIDEVPDAAALDRESWRRVAPFEARERWRILSGPAPESRRPLVAAGVDDGPPAAGVLLALTWRSGHRIPLPYVITAAGHIAADADSLGHFAERALAARPVPSDAPSFAATLATVLPLARARMLELSGSRYGTPRMGPAQDEALELLRREWETCHRHKYSYGDLDPAIEGLEQGVVAGFERQLAAELRRLHSKPMILATSVRCLLERLREQDLPVLHGTPRLDLIAALVLASECRR